MFSIGIYKEQGKKGNSNFLKKGQFEGKKGNSNQEFEKSLRVRKATLLRVRKVTIKKLYRGIAQTGNALPKQVTTYGPEQGTVP